jgi:hypothetical protein
MNIGIGNKTTSPPATTRSPPPQVQLVLAVTLEAVKPTL